MSNLMVAQTIIEVLEQMALDGKVFTAYDVTIAARLVENVKASPENVMHDDVRGIVGNEFVTQQLAAYDREFCILDVNGNPEAFVYFPVGKSASDHPLVSNSAPAVSSVSTVSTPVSVPISTPVVDLDDDEVATTKEGRVQIPRKLTSQVTPNGGSFDVLINGTLKCASKDARGDVRVCLRQFNITDSKVKVTVDTANNTINVETVVSTT